MFDVKELLERQAQASRRDLSWPEKLRMAAQVRKTVCQFARLREAERTESRRRGASDESRDDRA